MNQAVINLKDRCFFVCFSLTMFSLFLFFPENALAFSDGSTGLGNELYTFVVTDLIGGPAGTITGIACFTVAGIGLVKNDLRLAICTMLAGVIIINAGAFAKALGMTF